MRRREGGEERREERRGRALRCFPPSIRSASSHLYGRAAMLPVVLHFLWMREWASAPLTPESTIKHGLNLQEGTAGLATGAALVSVRGPEYIHLQCIHLHHTRLQCTLLQCTPVLNTLLLLLQHSHPLGPLSTLAPCRRVARTPAQARGPRHSWAQRHPLAPVVWHLPESKRMPGLATHCFRAAPGGCLSANIATLRPAGLRVCQQHPMASFRVLVSSRDILSTAVKQAEHPPIVLPLNHLSPGVGTIILSLSIHLCPANEQQRPC
ncbi:hypothetical protein JZ751_018220 [Albula glossodonta]|uniref:Uncharacterized protein n=1 Tax=Albula glossodonta TaxID=121402 RepID=A0A8T2NM72_9TELE|nr:hypothetical protein JZ751_018220 [Albula glossodonta]